MVALRKKNGGDKVIIKALCSDSLTISSLLSLAKIMNPIIKIPKLILQICNFTIVTVCENQSHGLSG